MTANLKLLGLTMGAILAISAAAASAAWGDQLDAETAPVRLTGAQEHFFLPPETGGFTIATDTFTLNSNGTGVFLECSGTTYLGTMASKPTSTFAVTPTFNACTYGVPAGIKTNGCEYLFHVNGEASTTGTVDIQCPVGQEITVTSYPPTPKCIFHIPSQAGLKAVTFGNLGTAATREVTVRIETQGLKYSQTEGTGLGKCSTASRTDGRWWAAFVITGEEDKEVETPKHIGIFLK